MATIKIKQIKSKIGYPVDQKRTLLSRRSEAYPRSPGSSQDLSGCREGGYSRYPRYDSQGSSPGGSDRLI